MNTLNRKIQSSRAKLLVEIGIAFSYVYIWAFAKRNTFWYCNPLKNDVHLRHFSNCSAYLKRNTVRGHYKEHSANDV